MTDPRPPFSEAEFHAAQRRRLNNPRTMPRLAGAWADSLFRAMHQLLPDQLHGPADQDAVLDCFANTPVDQVERLFEAVVIASEQQAPGDEAASLWATELTCYAAMRCLDADVWSGTRHWQGADDTKHATVHRLPTSSSLIAAIGLAGLQRLSIRLGTGKAPRGMVDLTALSPGSTDVVPELLARLYDRLLQDRPPRPNPGTPLTEDEVGQLRQELASLRLRREFGGAYVCLNALDQAGQETAAVEIARLLNAQVIHGATQHDNRLVQANSQMTVASLKAAIERIFRLLPAFEGDAPAAARAARPAVPVAPVTPTHADIAPARRVFTWDLFISHASEDKAAFVDALVAGLETVGLKVWYDRAELTVGDSLRKQIDQGLRDSRFAVVVLSPAYLAKGWPQGELDAALAHELTADRKRVLPVWLGVQAEDIQRFSPTLASRLAVNAADGLPSVVAKLLNAVQRAD